MLVWQGAGVLVAILGGGVVVLTNFVATKVFGEVKYGNPRPWIGFVAFGLAAALVWGLHRRLSRTPPRVVIDKETRQEIVLEERHTLFFIPVKYWPAIFLAIGVFVTIADMSAKS
jgi:hypothetical protein